MKLGLLLWKALLRRYPLRSVLIALCALFCFGGQLGLHWAGRTVDRAVRTMDTACNMSQLVVYTHGERPGTLAAALGQIPGVSAVTEACIGEPVDCLCADGQLRSVRFYALAPGGFLSPVTQGEGPWLSWAYQNDFDGAAVARLTLPGGETLAVTETAVMPLFTGVYVDRFVPSTDGDLVDILVSWEQCRDLYRESYVNYAALRLTEDADAQAVRVAIWQQAGLQVYHVAAEDPAYAAALSLGALVTRVCDLYPWIMLGVGLLFVWVFLAGLAGRNAHSLGLLRAQGAGNGAIFGALALFGLTAVLIGLVCSLPVARSLGGYIAKTTLGNMGIPYPGLAADAASLLPSVLGAVAVSVAGAGLSMVSVSDMPAAERQPTRGPGTNHWLRCAGITAVSTAACVCMAVMALLFLNALDALRQEQFSDRYGYDVQLVYEDFVPVSRLQELEATGLTLRCEPMLLGSVELYTEEASLETAAVGLSATPLLTLRDARGAALEIPENGILLCGATADRLQLRVGDLAQLRIRYGQVCIEALCRVAGISSQSTGFIQAVSLATVEQYLNSSGVMNSVAVKVSDRNLEAFAQWAAGQPQVLAVQTGLAGQLRFDQRYQGTRALMWVIIGVSVLLGLSVSLLMCYMQYRREFRKNTVLHMLGQALPTLLWQSARRRLLGWIPGLAGGLCGALLITPWLLRFLSTDAVVYPFVPTVGTLAVGVGLCLLYEAACLAMYAAACRRNWRQQAGRLQGI